MSASVSRGAESAREAARQRNGKFGAQHLPEGDGVDLVVGSDEFAAVASTDRRVRDLLGDVDDYLLGTVTRPEWVDRLSERLPAIGDAVGHDRSFDEEFLRPLVLAAEAGDVDEARRIARKLVDLDVAEQAYLDQDWRPPGVLVEREDLMYGNVFTGERYDSRRRLSETAKLMRADIKDAQAAGYIPPEFTYRVVTDSGGGAVRIEVEGMPDEDAFWRDYHSPYRNGREFGTRPSWARYRLTDRLRGIGRAYARQQNNSQVDYFNNSHDVAVTIRQESETMYWRHVKERSNLAAEIRRTPASDPNRTELLAQAEALHTEQKKELAAKQEADRASWGW